MKRKKKSVQRETNNRAGMYAVPAFLTIIAAISILFALSVRHACAAEHVIASTYGDAKDIRRTGETRTAAGRKLDANGMYAAHKTLPFGTRLTLYHGHRSAVVMINDRGPFIRGRTLDLTPAVNKQLWCGGLCRLRMEPWPPLPKPRPYIPEPVYAWGEEHERQR